MGSVRSDCFSFWSFAYFLLFVSFYQVHVKVRNPIPLTYILTYENYAHCEII